MKNNLFEKYSLGSRLTLSCPFYYAQKRKEVTTILQDEIIKTIETIVQKYISTTTNNQSRDVVSVVTGIKGNKYQVKIDNSTYWIKNGVDIEINVGNQVWIHIPNGKMNEMFIMAKR